MLYDLMFNAKAFRSNDMKGYDDFFKLRSLH